MWTHLLWDWRWRVGSCADRRNSVKTGKKIQQKGTLSRERVHVRVDANHEVNRVEACCHKGWLD